MILPMVIIKIKIIITVNFNFLEVWSNCIVIPSAVCHSQATWLAPNYRELLTHKGGRWRSRLWASTDCKSKKFDWHEAKLKVLNHPGKYKTESEALFRFVSESMNTSFICQFLFFLTPVLFYLFTRVHKWPWPYLALRECSVIDCFSSGHF